MPGPLDGLKKAGALEALGQHYAKPQTNVYPKPEIPEVPLPTMFQPDPFVVGRPEEARMAKQLLDTSPYAKASTHSITYGPTRGSMNSMIGSKFPIDTFEGTTLMGVRGRDDEAIGINPGFEGLSSLGTLAHEIGHSAGYGEHGAEEARQLVAPGAMVTPLTPLDKAVAALKKAGVTFRVE